MAKLADVKNYFSIEGHPVTNAEIIDFKKHDPDGYEEIKELLDEELGNFAGLIKDHD